MPNAVLYIILLISTFFIRPALADELKLVPSVTAKEEYNDNVFFSTSDRRSDFISTLTPGIELSDRSERFEADLLLRLNGIVYARTSELNAVDQDYRGSIGYMLSPLTKLSTAAGYIVDSQPDREILTTGLVIGPIKRHQQQYSLSVEHALTEKTSAALSYAYEQDDYDNNRFSNLRYHDASLTLSHDLDWLMRTAKGSVTFDYAHYTSSVILVDSLTSDSTVDNYSVTAGLSRAVSEVWSAQANFGGRYTVSKFRSWEFIGSIPTIVDGVPALVNIYSPIQQKSPVVGWVGQVALSYKGEKTEGSLSFNSDVQPASGQTSGTTIRTGLVASARRRFTYELSGNMSVGYYTNKSNPGAIAGQAIDQDTIILTPSVRYEFSTDMYMEASYQYVKVFNNISHTEADRNSVFVRFYIQHPFFM